MTNVTDEQVQQILDNLYDFKEQVRKAGNSRFVRLSNKDILFAVLLKVNDLKKENDKQNSRISRLEAVLFVLAPLAVALTAIFI